MEIGEDEIGLISVGGDTKLFEDCLSPHLKRLSHYFRKRRGEGG